MLSIKTFLLAFMVTAVVYAQVIIIIIINIINVNFKFVILITITNKIKFH